MAPNQYAFIDNGRDVFLLTLSSVSTVVFGAPTVDAAIAALLEAAPPNTLKGVYLINYADFESFRRPVEALKKAGYTNIEAIDIFELSMASFIYDLPLKCGVGDAVIVCTCLDTGLSATVLQKRKKGWQIVLINAEPSKALASYPSVRDVVFFEKESKQRQALIRKTFPGRKIHPSVMIRQELKIAFVRNRISKGDLDGYDVLPYCRYDMLLKIGDRKDVIFISDKVPPFTVSKEIDVGDAPTVEIRANDNGVDLVKTFKFTSTKFRVVSITVSVDKTLVPQVSLKTIVGLSTDQLIEEALNKAMGFLDDGNFAGFEDMMNRWQKHKDAQFEAAKKGASDGQANKQAEAIGATLPKQLSQLELNSTPTTILNFTSDNRVLIKADETYTGVKEVLAYVLLQDGKPPMIGQQAFDALKKNRDSVFYDLTRLLATDFNPSRPNPAWGFKTTRNTDGKVVIHGGGNVITFPIVLFGLVVKSTLLYIQKHMESDVTALGIRLPVGSVVSEDELKTISQRIGVDLMFLVD
uniref:Molybdopterin molybdotransferase n=1 Tax=Panagrellus redivivus TaxID=6233 RepID=A0A7E4VE66_PANRE